MCVVKTPLDLVTVLTKSSHRTKTVVLAGPFARDPAYADFIARRYPDVGIVVTNPGQPAALRR